ncbi:hypothetical protein ACQEVC_45580 [Plantactinospora sp. CA-294935]|uniref:hypothetical protein n=1 Tax=Plantactinospora sp. CA-294935 TaxID=3240012 RepID=UPI003D9040C5
MTAPMAKVTRSASRSIYIRSVSPYQGGMSVWALRDFVRALDAEEIPDDAKVECHRDHNTLHLTNLSVRVVTEDTAGTPAEEAAPTP